MANTKYPPTEREQHLVNLANRPRPYVVDDKCMGCDVCGSRIPHLVGDDSDIDSVIIPNELIACQLCATDS